MSRTSMPETGDAVVATRMIDCVRLLPPRKPRAFRAGAASAEGGCGCGDGGEQI